MVYDTLEEETGRNEENNVSSIEEELENSVEDRANDADIDIIQHGEEENSDQCEME